MSVHTCTRKRYAVYTRVQLHLRTRAREATTWMQKERSERERQWSPWWGTLAREKEEEEAARISPFAL